MSTPDELRRLYRLTDVEVRPWRDGWAVSVTASGRTPERATYATRDAAFEALADRCRALESEVRMVAVRIYDGRGRMTFSVRDSRTLPRLLARMRETRARVLDSARAVVARAIGRGRCA